MPIKRVMTKTRTLPVFILASVLAVAGCADTQTSSVPPGSANPEQREQSFDEFLDTFGKQAVAEGVRPATVERAFKGLSPNDRLLARLESQPEFVRPIWDYLRSAASDRRVADGKERMAKQRTRLRKVEDEYGVPAKVIVAIWGMESNFRPQHRQLFGRPGPRHAGLERPPGEMGPRRIDAGLALARPARSRRRRLQGFVGRRLRSDPVHAVDLSQPRGGR